MQQHNGNGAHLRNGIGLAEKARAKLTPSDSRVENCGNQENTDVPAKNQYCDRGWNQAFVHQYEKKRT
jgi:hypothetical protein